MKNLRNFTLVMIGILFGINFVNGQTLPADFDNSFGTNGNGIVNTNSYGSPPRVIVNANDQIITNHGYTFTVHSPNGVLIASKPCPLTFYCSTMALQPNGYILFAGPTLPPSGGAFGALGIARYDTNLNLDPTFGNGGIVITNIQNNVFHSPTAMTSSNQGILVAGGSGPSNISSTQHQFVARFTGQGNLDSTFGLNGSVIEPTIRGASSIAMQQDNVVVGGSLFTPQGPFATITVYDPSGRLSRGFNRGRIFAIGGSGAHVAVQPDSKIVFTGIRNGTSMGIGRLNPAGFLDHSFGTGGIAMFPFQNFAQFRGFALDSKRNIVLIGDWDDHSYSPTPPYPHRLFIARYDAGGNLDPKFVSSVPPQFNIPNGLRFLDFGTTQYQIFGGVALQQNGRIVVGLYTDAGEDIFSSVHELLRFNGN